MLTGTTLLALNSISWAYRLRPASTCDLRFIVAFMSGTAKHFASVPEHIRKAWQNHGRSASFAYLGESHPAPHVELDGFIQMEAQDKGGPADFSDRWVRHLRESAKTSAVFTCPRCEDHPLYSSREQFSDHVRAVHASEVSSDPVKAKIHLERLIKEASSARNSPSKRPAESYKSTNDPRHDEEQDDGQRSELEDEELVLRRPADFQDRQTDKRAPIIQRLVADVEKAQVRPPRKRPAYASIGAPNSPTYSEKINNVVAATSEAQIDPPSPSRPSPSAPPQMKDTDFRPRERMQKRTLYDPQSPTIPSAGKGPAQLRVAQHQTRQVGVRPHTHGATSLPRLIQPHNPPHPAPSLRSVPQSASRLIPDLAEPARFAMQPLTSSISQELLMGEVKGIYSGICMIERKCIQVDAAQAQLALEGTPGNIPPLSNEQYQALIALHRALLCEHHDFFLASQHPSSTPMVRRLASKYAMPARLWKHGIHAFLELLRNRLPHCLDHMLAFIYLAYNMMTLLYETVPAFRETWVECLGDLGRYRMAIEDDDIRDREVWTQVSRQWYMKASNNAPTTGRLYHHLAILARPNALQQLFYYGKALSVAEPFNAAKESILTLFQPVLQSRPCHHFPPLINAYIKTHAIIFTNEMTGAFNLSLTDFISGLQSYFNRDTGRFFEHDHYIAVANIHAICGYASPQNPIVKALSGLDTDAGKPQSSDTAQGPPAFLLARRLFIQTAHILLQQTENDSVLSYAHCTLVFLNHLSRSETAFQIAADGFPWQSLATLLNSLIAPDTDFTRIESTDFPIPQKDDFRPFPEDFSLRGSFWTLDYLPLDWFEDSNVDDENQYREEASVTTTFRPERILWQACGLARRVSQVFSYSATEHRFNVPDVQTSTGLDLEPGSPCAPVAADQLGVAVVTASV